MQEMLESYSLVFELCDLCFIRSFITYSMRTGNSYLHMAMHKYTYYMASSVSGQDESNPALWLATRAGKMELSCPLETTRRVPQKKISPKAI